MTELQSILKSRGITLLTKLPLVKAMIFPVVMYGCESWAEEIQNTGVWVKRGSFILLWVRIRVEA